MKYIFFVIFFILLLFYSCCTKSDLQININDDKSMKVLAKYNDSNIVYQKTIDSIIDSKLFDLRKSAIEELVFNDICLGKSEVDSIIISKEVLNYSLQNYGISIDEIDRESDVYKEILFEIKRSTLKQKILDESNFELYLTKDNINMIDLRELSLFKLNKTHIDKSKNRIVFISNYNCYYCQELHRKSIDIIAKYQNCADFYFSSLSVTVPKFFVYLKEKDYDYLFPDLNDFIFKNIDNTANYDSLVKLFLVKNSIDTMDYFYFKPTTEEYRKLKANADFLKQNNIYSTPTLIINDTVYNEPNLLDILKIKLENACKD